MYADKITSAMRQAITESKRRRQVQLAYNRQHHITPKTIKKAIRAGIEVYQAQEDKLSQRLDLPSDKLDLAETIAYLQKDMLLAAKNLQFEKAAQLRDKINELKQVLQEK